MNDSEPEDNAIASSGAEENDYLEDDNYAYSRSDTIAAITDFYEFLTKMYMDEAQVIHPPTLGWPSIVGADSQALELKFGKTDEVMALLAHLPYIRSPGNWNGDADAAPNCIFADWQDLIGALSSYSAGELRMITEGPPFCEFSAPHAFSLTCGDRETPVMVLDTHLGLVFWANCPSEVEEDPCREIAGYEPEEEDNVPEDEANWRYGTTTWTIPDFFEVLKDQFRCLFWIPISPHTVWGASWSETPDGMAAELQDIYRQHCWPDLDSYRKSECLVAVRRALEERYPSAVDSRG